MHYLRILVLSFILLPLSQQCGRWSDEEIGTWLCCLHRNKISLPKEVKFIIMANLADQIEDEKILTHLINGQYINAEQIKIQNRSTEWLLVHQHANCMPIKKIINTELHRRNWFDV